MEFKHNSTITALPNGMVQEKSFDPNKVTVVGGDIIKYPSGSSLKVESASKVIFEWRGHLFISKEFLDLGLYILVGIQSAP